MLRKRDKVVKKVKWEFDEEVAQVFDDMLSRSIPGYGLMRNLVTDIAVNYSGQKGNILDLGCSSGGSLYPIIETLGNSHKYVGIEVSEPMRNHAKKRFQDSDCDIDIIDSDLREGLPDLKMKYNCVLSVLTIQFVPIEYRQKIISDIYNNLNEGGVFIFVEKILGNNNFCDNVLRDLYYEMKDKNGYDEEQINAKKRALEGVLVPVTSAWNEDLLKSSGFKNVESFWRCLNFSGWIAFK